MSEQEPPKQEPWNKAGTIIVIVVITAVWLFGFVTGWLIHNTMERYFLGN